MKQNRKELIKQLSQEITSFKEEPFLYQYIAGHWYVFYQDHKNNIYFGKIRA